MPYYRMKCLNRAKRIRTAVGAVYDRAFLASEWYKSETKYARS